VPGVRRTICAQPEKVRDKGIKGRVSPSEWSLDWTHIPSPPKRVVGTLTPITMKSKLRLLLVTRFIFEGPAMRNQGQEPSSSACG
jgi:hypothetical protein